MTDPLELLEQGCRDFGLMDMKPITRIGECLVATEEGYYCFIATEQKVYHPLETILAGEPIRTGDWIADTADRLGVTAAWIAGFNDGFAQVREGATAADYIQGFLAAEAFRQRSPDLFEACE